MTRNVENKPYSLTGLLLIGLSWILSYSMIAQFSLIWEVYSPYHSMLLSCILVGVVSPSLLKLSKSFDILISWKFTLFVLVVATILRSPPYINIHGGQDQGVYFAMAQHFERGEEIFFKNDIQVRDNDELALIGESALKVGRDYLPGIYKYGEQCVFQFYHLWPLWMALSSFLFGIEGSGHVLVFFGVFVVLFLSLIVKEITKSDFMYKISLVLFAIHPLFIYFSKWSVTEIPSLFFTSSGLLLFLISLRKSTNNFSSLLLCAFGAIVFSLYFFTRISGFVFLPFLFFCLIISVLIKQTNLKRVILTFVSIVLISYVLSVVYGLRYSPIYSGDVYANTFRSLRINGYEIEVLAVIISALVLITAAVAKFRKILLKYSVIRMSVLSVLIALLTIFLLGILTTPQNDRFTDVIGPSSILNNSAINFLIYTGFLPLLIVPFFRINGLTSIRFLSYLVFLIAPFIFIFLLKPYIPYQYYYSRYMLSELIPYSLVVLLLIISYSTSHTQKYISIFPLIIIGLISLPIVGTSVGHNTFKSLKRIKHELDSTDQLLFIKGDWNFHYEAILTSLDISLGLNVIPINDLSEMTELWSTNCIISKNENNLTNDMFVLSPKLLNANNLLLKDRINHIHHRFILSRFIPFRKTKSYWSDELFLYQVKSENEHLFIDGMVQNDVWSSSRIIIECKKVIKARSVVINTFGWRPENTWIEGSLPTIEVNGKVYPAKKERNTFKFDIEEDNVLNKVVINVGTFIPEAYSLNNDKRSLGLDIKSICIE